ncbi:MAG TPA: tRNA uridine-5-carboxymethylaminomethyl(34) synthesis GTPase MnmE [Vicinamibacterales bacterium]|nr:tRNA uridine-5-carboxymethylaminomethyl(34) synthesis GTPase MnmE [Vicinamibacterales bacterium]
MFSPADTIVAIATPPGRGGVGIVRISGPDASGVASRILVRDAPLEPRHATFTKVCSTHSPGDARAVDEVIATWFPAPHSYTGEHVVEVSAHGSPVVLQAMVQGAIGAGARLARPGEFTFRAFLNGKRDLVQAEAVADLIAAATPLQARVAFDQLEGSLTTQIQELDTELLDLIARLEGSLDFPEEGFHFIDPRDIGRRITCVIDRLDTILREATRGRVIREGATVVIAGRPNVGKSSLFNALLGHARAIVTETPGTTRDLVTETVELDGLAVTLVDTAGLRETTEAAEQEGVSRGVRARTVADLVVVVLDRGQHLTNEDMRLLDETSAQRRVIVANKCDRAAVWTRELSQEVSAANGAGIGELRRAIVHALTGDEHLRDTAAISNVRHAALLESARVYLDHARGAASDASAAEEFVLADLHAARMSLGEVVGIHTSEDVLRHIFERFCVGK